MRTTVSHVRSADNVLEIRVVARNCVMLSHINYSQLERVRQVRAQRTKESGHDDHRDGTVGAACHT
jgi:hypothetical protein